MEHYKLYKLLKSINNGTDTSDATVTPRDLMEGVVAYGPEGKIEGIVQDRKGDVMGLSPRCYIVNGQDYLWTEFKPGLTITDENSKYQPKIHFSNVAETIGLTSDKLVSGNTILGIEGTAKILDTSDADASAEDLVYGKTAYVNGQKIIGNVEMAFSAGGGASDITVEDTAIHFSHNLDVPTLIKRSFGISVMNEELVPKIGLTSDKIVSGNTVLGVKGSAKTLDTSDATATANDIVQGKTAYVGGKKVTGNVKSVSSMGAGIGIEGITLSDVSVNFRYNLSTPTLFQDGFSIYTTNSTLASKLGLTADKIVKGNTILGVEGVADSAVDEASIESLKSLISPTDRTFFILPNGITEICDYAFYKKNNIVSSITEIPEGVTRIGKSAFHECDNLRLQKLPTTLTTVEDQAFYDCDNVLLTELPPNITKIGSSAFYYCCNMPVSELPPNLTTIGDYAFYACFDLAVKEIPAGVTVINSAAFRSCGITELTILGNITKIASYAFYASDELGKIVMPNITTVPTLGHIDAFDRTLIGTGNGIIYVPDSLVNNFKTATNWSTFADQIKPISELEV